MTTENTIKREKPVLVKSIHLAYRIIEQGYLHQLVGVRKNRDNPNRNVWFFAPTPEVIGLLNEYVAERAAAHDM